ncbi:MAG TPA: methyl-accepting chemotaxis protein, partial [Geobacteraceae bacterium]
MKADWFSFRSISTRFLVLTIALVVILFGGLGIIIAGQNVAALRSSLNSKSNSVADLACRTGAEHLMNFNFIGLDHLIEDIVKDPEVSFAGFYNEKKELVTKRPVPAATGGLLVIERSVKDSGDTVIGSFKIGYRQDAVTRSLSKSILFVGAGTVIAIILFSLGVSIIVRRITNPLRQGITVAESIACGDLDFAITDSGKDETGQLLLAMKTMGDKLKGVVMEVKIAADNVAGGSQELSASSASISQGSTEQAVAAEEASASMEQMTSNVRQT